MLYEVITQIGKHRHRLANLDAFRQLAPGQQAFTEVAGIQPGPTGLQTQYRQ